MGKGKGSRLGVNARINTGNFILAVTGVRLGLWAKICRFVISHCSFKVKAGINSSKFCLKKMSTNSTRQMSNMLTIKSGVRSKSFSLSTSRYVVPQILELYGVLQKLRKIKLFIYFFKLFQFYSVRSVFLNQSFRSYFRELHAIWRLRRQKSGFYFFLVRSSRLLNDFSKKKRL
jgi:hypothetical protein